MLVLLVKPVGIPDKVLLLLLTCRGQSLGLGLAVIMLLMLLLGLHVLHELDLCAGDTNASNVVSRD